MYYAWYTTANTRKNMQKIQNIQWKLPSLLFMIIVQIPMNCEVTQLCVKKEKINIFFCTKGCDSCNLHGSGISGAFCWQFIIFIFFGKSFRASQQKEKNCWISFEKIAEKRLNVQSDKTMDNQPTGKMDTTSAAKLGQYIIFL